MTGQNIQANQNIEATLAWLTIFLSLIASLLWVTFGSLETAQAQVQPTSIVETVEQGYLAHRRGDYQKAIEIYTSIIRRRGLSIKERAVSYLLRGEAKRDMGQLEEAVYDFTRAINQWPNYPQAIFFRGQVLARLDKLNEAYADLTRAVELDPDRESYQTNLALLKKRMQSVGLVPQEKDYQLENMSAPDE
ncbi:MAG: tetratricopeptide repeat protein [Deltaproteobacteria bacterium]|jgi:tetratricopeptide (TPR) repeat protein|nr:tetratricopeptide repeat protein [Deltaproteobacteria bacterium]